MKILIYLGHPAQYHFFKNTVGILREKGNEIFFVIRSKDMLEQLLKNDGENYVNILSKGRKDSKTGILLGLIKRDFRLYRIVKENKFDLMIGTDSSIAHIGKLFNTPCITTIEDDYDVVPSLARLTYPFTRHILAPAVCDVGKWESKKISYNGYMKLAYLHPNHFQFDCRSVENSDKKKILIRTAKLKAHHDFGINGLDIEIIKKIIKEFSDRFDIVISSESALTNSLLNYEININPNEIHSFLSGMDILISDSQSMSVEASMLGIPSIRFSDFAGKISILEELEHKYGLTFGIKTSEPEKLFSKINELLSAPNLKEEWQQRRQKMLSEKIDVTAFMVWFIENYPESVKVTQDNSDYQYNFK